MLDRPRLSIAMTWVVSAAMLAPCAGAQAGPAQAPAPAAAPMERPPILTGPGVITVPAGGAVTTWFTVADDRTPPAALEFTISVPDRALLPEGSVRLEGEGSRRALTIAPPPGRAGSVSLSMTVVDSDGLSTRGSVVVTVVEAVESRPIPIPPAPPIIQPTGTGAGTTTTTSAMAWPCGPFASVSSRGGRGAMASEQSTGWSSPASASWSGSAGPVVSRYDLVRGRTASDGPALFDAAYQHYWAGSYAQAEEAAAAAAYLWDDPRAWEYLAMSAAARGDEATAAPAARYAAAKVLAEPTFENDLARSLTRLQGPERRRIESFQTGIVDRTAALEVLAARPDVLHGMVPSPAPAPARQG